MPVEVSLIPNCPCPLLKHHALPFVLASIRHHFSSPGTNRYFPENSHLIYTGGYDGNLIIAEAQASPWLRGSLPAIYVQLAGQASPVTGVGGDTLDRRTFLRYFENRILITVLSQTQLSADLIMDEVAMLLSSLYISYGRYLGIPWLMIDEVEEPKSTTELTQGQAVVQDAFMTIATVRLGIVEQWQMTG